MIHSRPIFYADWSKAFSAMPLANDITISFHHHLRNGDTIVDRVMRELARRGLINLKVAASAIFPSHHVMADMMKQGIIRSVHTAYANGPVALAISQGYCQETSIFTTHGGRPRAILSGELPIHIAFLAAPTVDVIGNISGRIGPSACGSLGYAIADAAKADFVVAITDHLVDDELTVFDIPGYQVDMVLKVDSLGDPKGIVSGTTKPSRDPVGLLIASRCLEVIEASDLIKNNMAFQMGAGGISLAVAQNLRHLMTQRQLVGKFASGGITAEHVNMLEQGLVSDLYDVQCFDTAAVASLQKNRQHHSISASQYANPDVVNNIANQLDFIILGASQIDHQFQVNVTTGIDGTILGGSGGHADTATGAKCSLIVSKLVNARLPVLVEKVHTITTPGHAIDVLVTDYGVAVNPSSPFAGVISASGIKLRSMEELQAISHRLSGVPREIESSEKVVAYSTDAHGRVLDVIHQTLRE